MGRIIRSEISEVLDGSAKRISSGLKPSGLIHLGTATTFLHGMLALLSNPESKLEINVMDLDYDHQRGKSFPSFMYKKDPFGCHELMKYHTLDEVNTTLKEMATYFGISDKRIVVSLFSEGVERGPFKGYIKDLFLTEEGRRILKTTVMGTRQAPVRILVSPICKKCGYSSNTKPKQFTPEGSIVTTCFNPECDVEDFKVNLNHPKSYNLFYLVDPIRDLVPDENGDRVDLHIFGGDYGLPYGQSGTPKAERVFSLMSSISGGEVPSVYVGPILTYNGEKIGKSLANGSTLRDLRERKSNWVGRLSDLLLDNPKEKEIDLLTNRRYFE